MDECKQRKELEQTLEDMPPQKYNRRVLEELLYTANETWMIDFRPEPEQVELLVNLFILSQRFKSCPDRYRM